jgi:hypothetical protein
MTTFSNRELTPLIHSNTTDDIPSFPRTLAVLKSLQGPATNKELSALEFGITRRIEDRRDRIRVVVGLEAGGVCENTINLCK